jgi:hypothetical protein
VTFPDPPRGRRARPENGSPDRPGYDDASAQEREFPDLSPIRPREGHRRAGGRHSAGGAGAGVGAGASGVGEAGVQGPWDAQEQHYGQAQQQYAPPAPPAPQRTMQQPPAGQPSSGQQPPEMGQPAAGPPSAGQSPNGAPSDWDDQDSNDPMAAFSERWHRRGQESTVGSRKRTRLYLIGGGVVAVAVAVLCYFLVGGSGGPVDTGLGDLITTFEPGELQQVPDACGIVPSATLGQYLPGKQKTAAPPLNSGAQSECTWTVDNPPTYRVLEVYLTAYAPNALVGNGSATFAATFAISEDETAKQHPGAKSGQPAATVANISDLGTSAFSSYQVFDESNPASGEPTVTDMATVYVRYRNVVIEVVLNGLDKGTGTGGKQYGPVSGSVLQSEARTVAKQVTAKITG